MSNKIDIILLDDSYIVKEEININRPQNFIELISIINDKIKNIPKNYSIFYQSENNEEKIITNNKEFNSSIDILFIREINMNLGQSKFYINYKKLSESEKEIIDDQFGCLICAKNIKNEKPLLCYNCQKIYHRKCLEELEKIKKQQDLKFECPN